MSFVDILKKAFPFITTAASMTGGPLAGMAANALGKVLGAEVKPADLKKQMEQLTMTEDGRLKLDQAEKDFQATMTKMGFDNAEKLAEIEAADRDSARRREENVKDHTPAIIAYVVTVGFFVTLLLIMKWGVPVAEAGRDAALMLIGALAGGFTQNVLGYYFGSSKGSADKNAILANKQ